MKAKWLKIAELRESESKILLTVLKEENSRRPRRLHEDVNSIFQPNVTFTRSCETIKLKKCDFSWKYDQIRFGWFFF